MIEIAQEGEQPLACDGQHLTKRRRPEGPLTAELLADPRGCRIEPRGAEEEVVGELSNESERLEPAQQRPQVRSVSQVGGELVQGRCFETAFLEDLLQSKRRCLLVTRKRRSIPATTYPALDRLEIASGEQRLDGRIRELVRR